MTRKLHPLTYDDEIFIIPEEIMMWEMHFEKKLQSQLSKCNESLIVVVQLNAA